MSASTTTLVESNLVDVAAFLVLAAAPQALSDPGEAALRVQARFLAPPSDSVIIGVLVVFLVLVLVLVVLGFLVGGVFLLGQPPRPFSGDRHQRPQNVSGGGQP